LEKRLKVTSKEETNPVNTGSTHIGVLAETAIPLSTLGVSNLLGIGRPRGEGVARKKKGCQDRVYLLRHRGSTAAWTARTP
jgi:hypothetical protein